MMLLSVLNILVLASTISGHFTGDNIGNIPDNTDFSIHRSYKKRGTSASDNTFEKSIQNFNEKSQSTLIVIDTEKESKAEKASTTESKKSDITRNIDERFSDGFTIIIDNNNDDDVDQRDVKKDAIYKEMENNYEEIQQRFGDVIKQPLRRKHVRLIVITPNEEAQNRMIVSEHPIEDSDAGIPNQHHVSTLSSNVNKQKNTELEEDIEKLKKVREKMNQLKEINIKEKAVQDDPNKSNNDEISSNQSSTDSTTNTDINTTVQPASQSGKHNDKETNINKNTTGRDDEQTQDHTTLINFRKLQPHEGNPFVRNNVKQNTTVADDNTKATNQIKKSKKDRKTNEEELDKIVQNTPIKPPANPHPSENVQDFIQAKHYPANGSLLSKTPTSNRKDNKLKEQQINTTDPSINKPDPLVFKNLTNNFTIEMTVSNGTSALPPDQDIVNLMGIEVYTKQNSHNSEKDTSIAKDSQLVLLGKSNKSTNENVNILQNRSDTVQHDEKVLVSPHIEDTQNTNNDSISTQQNDLPKILGNGKAEAIIEYLNRDPLETWRFPFNTLTSLNLNATILRSGLVNPGDIERLKGVMRRALAGQDIVLSIIGGSISAGGGLYKDLKNIKGLYYKGVVDWWNKMIKPLTGSSMVVNNVAIGSIGTDYFSYCVKNHIRADTDIVLWELSANDYNRYKMLPAKGGRPFERFTRIVLELEKRPALLYLNFFKGNDFKNSHASCPNFEDQEEDVIAHYYKIPSLSWRAMVCRGLVQSEPGFLLDDLFSNDQYHPSLKGHAQASLLLLLHLRHVMRAVLQLAIQYNGKLEHFEDAYTIPDPLFLGPRYPEPYCWTLVSANISDPITNNLQVRVVKDQGFRMEYATNFPIRYDKVSCWKAEKPYAMLSIFFAIQENPYEPSNKKYELAITTHTRWGGSSFVWIDEQIEKALVIREGRLGDPGKRTQVDTISSDLTAGSHTLNIQSSSGGFCLAAIMIDAS